MKDIVTEDPVQKFNQVTSGLSSDNPDCHIILIVDELITEPDTDWNGLETRKNVTWLLALQPLGFGAHVNHPTNDERVLSRRLLYKHRMSPAIR